MGLKNMALNQAAHDTYENMAATLSQMTGDKTTAYRLIWGSVAEVFIVMSDPDKSQVELLGAVMARIDGGTAYDLDIWWPVRAVYQREHNPEEFSRSYTAEDLTQIADYEAFDKKYGFGFRTGFVGSFWRQWFRNADDAQVGQATDWFQVFTDAFMADVFAIADRYADKLLFKGDTKEAAGAKTRRSAWLNAVRQVPNLAKRQAPDKLPKPPKKSFADYLAAREEE